MGEKRVVTMKAYFTRLNQAGQLLTITGELFIDTGNWFKFFFDIPAKEIVLNDGQAHNLETLEGHIQTLWMDRDGLYLHAFLKMPKDKWHKDQLTFRFNKRTS